MSLAHVSRNAGIALGSSTSSTLTTGRPTTFRGVLAAPSAPSVVDFGAPVVRSAPSGKEEGRVPSVSRVESRPSESGRQDSTCDPLVPNRSRGPKRHWNAILASHSATVAARRVAPARCGERTPRPPGAPVPR
jgi:hypothetical protein